MSMLLRRAGFPLALAFLLVGIGMTPGTASAQAVAVAPAPYPAGDATVTDIESIGRRPADLDWMEIEGAPRVQIAYLLTDQTGASPYAYRLRFPADYAIIPHRHQARMHLTVLQGTYMVGFGPTLDRARTVAFPTGSYIWIPKRSAHFGWTEGETILQVHGTGPMNLDWVAGEGEQK